ncbi:MAG: DUF429 domain-containing protein [Anaerolineae bacterium]|nr:DUF429 domain-containing protein [Anaerolineae bacterium]
MKTVLGIDAAWTPGNPSGVALVQGVGRKWKCLGVAPSYESFISLADGRPVDWKMNRFDGTPPDVSRLLQAARELAKREVDLVAIDMPVSNARITGRRRADNRVSEVFGGRNCATHSPSAERPGKMGEKIAKGFAEAGNKLVTEMDSPPTSPGLIEVYPHPALLSLLKLNERAMYKSSKSRSYWPEASLDERIRNLIAMHKKIKDALSERFEGLNGLISIRKVESLSHLKKVEDALDALICAWVGIEYLAGRTVPLGDRTAAIWCPADVVNSQQPA